MGFNSGFKGLIPKARLRFQQVDIDVLDSVIRSVILLSLIQGTKKSCI